MRKISALFCVYNDAVFTKTCLRGIEPCVDQIVIVEGSWDGERGTYDYGVNKSSTDGTRDIVNNFASSFPNKTIVIDSIGDEECSRNAGLSLCDHNWVLHLDSDEFYSPYELSKLKERLEDIEKEHDRIRFAELSFYFNFKHYLLGSKIRMFDQSRKINYFSANGVGDNLQGGIQKTFFTEDVAIFHFQWIGDRHKVLSTRNIDREKKFQLSRGEDPNKVIPMGGWRWWLNDIYLKFNGENLKELELKNRGSIHPWSFLHEDQRHHELNRVNVIDVFPKHIKSAPWFDFKEKGLIKLKQDI